MLQAFNELTYNERYRIRYYQRIGELRLYTLDDGRLAYDTDEYETLRRQKVKASHQHVRRGYGFLAQRAILPPKNMKWKEANMVCLNTLPDKEYNMVIRHKNFPLLNIYYKNNKYYYSATEWLILRKGKRIAKGNMILRLWDSGRYRYGGIVEELARKGINITYGQVVYIIYKYRGTRREQKQANNNNQ